MKNRRQPEKICDKSFIDNAKVSLYPDSFRAERKTVI